MILKNWLLQTKLDFWPNKLSTEQTFLYFPSILLELCLLFQNFKIIRIIIILGVNTGFIWVKPNKFHDVITKQLCVQIEIWFLLTFKPTFAIILAYEHNSKVLSVRLYCSYSLQIMKIKNHNKLLNHMVQASLSPVEECYTVLLSNYDNQIRYASGYTKFSEIAWQRKYWFFSKSYIWHLNLMIADHS